MEVSFLYARFPNVSFSFLCFVGNLCDWLFIRGGGGGGCEFFSAWLVRLPDIPFSGDPLAARKFGSYAGGV